MSLRAQKLRVRGHVQGVMFRETMRKTADRIGVTGWVRNRADGSVEAFVQGEAGALEEILQWARLGPPRGRVDDIQSEETTPDPSLTTFERRETA